MRRKGHVPPKSSPQAIKDLEIMTATLSGAYSAYTELNSKYIQVLKELEEYKLKESQSIYNEGLNPSEEVTPGNSGLVRNMKGKNPSTLTRGGTEIPKIYWDVPFSISFIVSMNTMGIEGTRLELPPFIMMGETLHRYLEKLSYIGFDTVDVEMNQNSLEPPLKISLSFSSGWPGFNVRLILTPIVR